MTEKMLYKARKREKRFRIFLKTSLIFHALALGMFFLGLCPGGIRECVVVGAVFFGMGALFSGLAGLHANYFWGVAESVITSKEQYEKLLKLCGELE